MSRIVFAVALLTALVACNAPVAPRASVDPGNPASVLNAYLDAIASGDCATGRTFATESFRKGNGELCGAVRVEAVRIQPRQPAGTADELVFATTLTTGGSQDGSVPAGEITWFYDLKRQVDGTWGRGRRVRPVAWNQSSSPRHHARAS